MRGKGEDDFHRHTIIQVRSLHEEHSADGTSSISRYKEIIDDTKVRWPLAPLTAGTDPLPRPTCLPVGSVDWSLAKKVDQLLFKRFFS